MSEFQRLLSITDAVYLRAQQSLRTVLLQEARLRGELKKLDDHVLKARTDQTDTIETLRVIGADLLWEGWIAKARAQLNLELATVLAQKEQNIGSVRKAFGKRTVSEKLSRQDTAAKQSVARHRELDQAIGHSFWDRN